MLEIKVMWVTQYAIYYILPLCTYADITENGFINRFDTTGDNIMVCTLKVYCCILLIYNIEDL